MVESSRESKSFWNVPGGENKKEKEKKSILLLVNGYC
jgi:hypothetical protein